MPPFTASPRRHRGAVRTGLAAAVLAAALAGAAAPAPAQDPRPQPLWNTYPLRAGTPGGQAAGASPRASLGASPAVRNAVERAPGPGDATGAVVLLASLMALTALLTVALRARRRPPTPSAPLSVPRRGPAARTPAPGAPGGAAAPSAAPAARGPQHRAPRPRLAAAPGPHPVPRQEEMTVPRPTTHTLTRKEALGAALAAGGAAAGGVLLGGPDPASSRQAGGGTDALNEVLNIERLQAGLYAAAAGSGALTGELAAFATTVAEQERDHVAVLTRLLGANADRPPEMRFGNATSDAAAFSLAARKLEDLATRAYNVQALALSGRALREVLRIVSVEARHAAWIRDIRGETPAPDAVEPGESGPRARAALQSMGFFG